jgi:hypothetical protein
MFHHFFEMKKKLNKQIKTIELAIEINASRDDKYINKEYN